MKTILPILLILLVGAGCSRSRSKADTFLQQGDFERAVVYYGKALEENPGSRESRAGLGKALLQKALYLEKIKQDRRADWDIAVRELAIAQNIKYDAECRALLSFARDMLSRKIIQGGDTLLGLSLLEELLQDDYRNVEARNYSALLHYGMGNTDRAEHLFIENTVVDSLNPTAYFNLGMLHWQKKDYELAYEWWVRAFRLKPEDEEIMYWMVKAEKILK